MLAAFHRTLTYSPFLLTKTFVSVWLLPFRFLCLLFCAACKLRLFVYSAAGCFLARIAPAKGISFCTMLTWSISKRCSATICLVRTLSVISVTSWKSWSVLTLYSVMLDVILPILFQVKFSQKVYFSNVEKEVPRRRFYGLELHKWHFSRRLGWWDIEQGWRNKYWFAIHFGRKQFL